MTFYLRSACIDEIYRIIAAIGEHIAAEDALSGGGEAVRVEEAAEGGVVVSALEVVESRLYGLGVATTQKISLFCSPQIQPKNVLWEMLWLGMKEIRVAQFDFIANTQYKTSLAKQGHRLGFACLRTSRERPA